MRFPERTRVSVLGSLDFPDRDSSRCGGCSRSGICVALPDRLLLEIIRNLRCSPAYRSNTGRETSIYLTTFSSLSWNNKGKVTRRERFLAEMDAVIP